MKRKKHGRDEIIRKLREAEVMEGQGQTLAQVCQKLEISEQTLSRWRKLYRGMGDDHSTSSSRWKWMSMGHHSPATPMKGRWRQDGHRGENAPPHPRLPSTPPPSAFALAITSAPTPYDALPHPFGYAAPGPWRPNPGF